MGPPRLIAWLPAPAACRARSTKPPIPTPVFNPDVPTIWFSHGRGREDDDNMSGYRYIRLREGVLGHTSEQEEDMVVINSVEDAIGSYCKCHSKCPYIFNP